MQTVLCALQPENMRLLRNALEGIVSSKRTFECNTVDELIDRLNNPFHTVGVAVLMAEDGGDLTKFERIEKYLDDIKVILVVLDTREQDLVARCHSLRPRFLGLGIGELWRIQPVLKKIAASEF